MCIRDRSPTVIGLTSGALIANYAMTINGAGPALVTVDAAKERRKISEQLYGVIGGEPDPSSA